MSAKKIYDLAVVVGTYQKNGETKNRYQNIGAVMQMDGGSKFLLIDRSFNPAGVPFDASKGNQILVSMFDQNRDQQGGGGQRQAERAAAGGPDGDDIPF